MKPFVADTSAFIAVLNDEADADRFKGAFHLADAVRASTVTIFEAYCVATREALPDGHARLTALIAEIAPDIFAFDESQLTAARSAYARYGRGSRHRACLNMGDCFAYALARTRAICRCFSKATISSIPISSPS